jgi:hypothetical protein
LRRHAPPDFVEEIHHQRYMILKFPWLRALRRHKHSEALAVGREIDVHRRTGVRELLSEPCPRLVRYKRRQPSRTQLPLKKQPLVPFQFHHPDIAGALAHAEYEFVARDC